MAFIGSTTPLKKSSDAAGKEYESQVFRTDRADYISGVINTDQAGTLFVEQSGDGANWDLSKSFPVTANTTVSFSESLLCGYVRVRFENGTDTDQGHFRLFSRYTSVGDS